MPVRAAFEANHKHGHWTCESQLPSFELDGGIPKDFSTWSRVLVSNEPSNCAGDDNVVLDMGMHDVLGGHVESPAASREEGDRGGGGRGGLYWESGTGFGPFGWNEGWRGSLRGSFWELLNARTGFRLHVNAEVPGENQSLSAAGVARGSAPSASPLDDAEMGAATQHLLQQDDDAPSVPGQPQEGGGEGGQQAPIVVWAGRSSPFIIFFLSVLLLEHLESMCVLVIFNTMLWKCNAAMRRQALSRKVYELLGIMVLVVGQVRGTPPSHPVNTRAPLTDSWQLWFVSGSNHKLMGGRSMWGHLSLVKYEGSANFVDILWVVVMGDVLARQLSLAFKSTWLILMGNVLSQRSNFKLISFQEALATFQREFLPIPLW